ncbi:translation elongation factor Ts [candidate division FCPU426 bacterium]|nr:translation elongation factor Ts [candidate division FCPU426 bacterium]
MTISASVVKELREKTGVGMMECKAALQECNGDMDKAMTYLREKGLASAAKRAGRVAADGTVAAYIHAGGKLGVMVEVNVETDFVAKTDEFQALAKDVAMHIAAANPQYVKREDVPEAMVQKERDIYKAQMADTKKPPEILEKIISGKLEKFYEEVCLLEQAYIKDPDKKVSQRIAETIAKVGENVQVRRFARFQVGEE